MVKESHILEEGSSVMTSHKYVEQHSRLVNMNRLLTRGHRLLNTIGHAGIMMFVGLWCTILFFYTFIRYSQFSGEQINQYYVLLDFTIMSHRMTQVADSSLEVYMMAAVKSNNAEWKNVEDLYGEYQSFSGENGVVGLAAGKAQKSIADMSSLVRDMFSNVLINAETDIGAIFYKEPTVKWILPALSRVSTEGTTIQKISLTPFGSISNLLYSFQDLLQEIKDFQSLSQQSTSNQPDLANMYTYIRNSANEAINFTFEYVLPHCRDLVSSLRQAVVINRYAGLSYELYVCHMAIGIVAVMGVAYSCYAISLFRNRLVCILKAYAYLKVNEIEFMIAKLKMIKSGVFEKMMFNELALVRVYFEAWNPHPRTEDNKLGITGAKQSKNINKRPTARQRDFRYRRMPSGCKWILYVIFLIIMTFLSSLMLAIVGLQEQNMIGKVVSLYVDIQLHIMDTDNIYMDTSLYGYKYFDGYYDELDKQLTRAIQSLKHIIVDGHADNEEMLGIAPADMLLKLFNGDLCSLQRSEAQKIGLKDGFCSDAIKKSALKGALGVLTYQEFLYSNILKPIVEEYDESHGKSLSSDTTGTFYLPWPLYFSDHLIEFRLARFKTIDILQSSFYKLFKNWLTQAVISADEKLRILLMVTVNLLFLVGFPSFFYCMYVMYLDMMAAFAAYELIDTQVIINNAAIANEVKKQFCRLT